MNQSTRIDPIVKGETKKRFGTDSIGVVKTVFVCCNSRIQKVRKYSRAFERAGYISPIRPFHGDAAPPAAACSRRVFIQHMKDDWPGRIFGVHGILAPDLEITTSTLLPVLRLSIQNRDGGSNQSSQTCLLLQLPQL
jgi:hypothetical protein